MKKTPLDKLSDSLEAILADYRDGVTESMSEVTKKFGKKGAQAVRGESQGEGWGEYASGWTYQFEQTRLSATATIYNKTPGLPHLLEKGHALRGGGRSRAFPHIAPVEEKLTEDYLRAVKKEI